MALLPRPKQNWRRVALLAWSQWCVYIAILLQSAEFIMPYLLDYSSPAWVKVVAFVVTALAAYVKLLPQRSLPEEEPAVHEDSP